MDEKYIKRIKRYVDELKKVKDSKDPDLDWECLDPYDQDAYIAWELIIKWWETKYPKKK